MPSHNVLYARFKIFYSCRLQSLCFKNQIKKSWVLTRQCTSCVLVVILSSSEYKQCEKDIKDTIDETQHPTEHLAFIVVHKISAIYRDLNIRRLIQPINTLVPDLNEENHASHDQEKCIDNVWNNLHITLW